VTSRLLEKPLIDYANGYRGAATAAVVRREKGLLFVFLGIDLEECVDALLQLHTNLPQGSVDDV
jgi:hypothetical protein